MKEQLLSIINDIRKAKNLGPLQTLKESDSFRSDLELTSFDLAELTVRVEDEFGVDIFENGLINTVGEIYTQLEK
jgi:acyl carrier protein